jgi:hypothetical protein
VVIEKVNLVFCLKDDFEELFVDDRWGVEEKTFFPKFRFAAMRLILSSLGQLFQSV